MTFPHVVGYRTDLGTDRLDARFDRDSAMTPPATDARLALRTEVAGGPGEEAVHDLNDLRALREQEVAFRLARSLTGRLVDDSTDPHPSHVPAGPRDRAQLDDRARHSR